MFEIDRTTVEAWDKLAEQCARYLHKRNTPIAARQAS
jgi:hypothetical protein